MTVHSDAQGSPLLPRSAPAWLMLIGFALLPTVLGALSGLATMDSVNTWYETIVRPTWAPPNWVFGPVWTLLYVSMGVAAWWIWRAPDDEPLRRPALAAFAAQLALNLAWSPIFFGLQSPGWALVEIAILWLALVATVVLFWRVRRAAGLLLVPYLAWVSFASVLNGAIWWLNRPGM